MSPGTALRGRELVGIISRPDDPRFHRPGARTGALRREVLRGEVLPRPTPDKTLVQHTTYKHCHINHV